MIVFARYVPLVIITMSVFGKRLLKLVKMNSNIFSICVSTKQAKSKCFNRFYENNAPGPFLKKVVLVLIVKNRN